MFSSSEKNKTNWYVDKYNSVVVQRNILLITIVIFAFILLICVSVLSRIQKDSDIKPYIIEYNNNTGLLTVIETQSKKEYTAQQAVKESMVIQYINHREAPKLSTIEDDMNYIRVMTSSKLYGDYTKSISELSAKLRNTGSSAKYSIDITDFSYLTASRVQIKMTRKLYDNNDVEIDSNDYKIIISFGFSDLILPLEEMRINPLGFQVTQYNISQVKQQKPVIQITSNSDNNNKDE